MSIAQSKLTAQGQISVPAEIRRRLAIGPGSVLEWEEKNGQVIVRKAGRHTSVDLHRALFDDATKLSRPADVKEAIKKQIRRRYARDRY